MTLMDGWIADYGYVVFNLPWVGFYFPDSNFSQEKIMASESGEEVSAPTLILKSETIIGKWSARNLSCEYHYSFKLWFPISWRVSMEKIRSSVIVQFHRYFRWFLGRIDLEWNCVDSTKATLQLSYLLLDNNSRYSRILARITDIIGIL